MTAWTIDGMTDSEASVGKFFDLIQSHIDAQPYEIRDAQLAKRLGVTQTTVRNWEHPKRLIAKKHIVAVAALAGVRYSTALDALLDDIGYLVEDSDEAKDENLEVS